MNRKFFTALAASLLSISTITLVATPIIREIHTQQELMNLIKTEKNLIINFSKPNCPFCVYIDPIYKKAAQACKEPVVFASVKILENPEWYKKEFGFTTVPTVVYYKDGKKQRSHGSENRGVTKEFILNIIAQLYTMESRS
jgi:thiol-disulfide isomerase/thioredoxin